MGVPAVRRPEVVGVAATEATDRRPEDHHQRDERDGLDQLHRRDPDLSTRWGVDDVQHPDPDEHGGDRGGDRRGRDDPAAVGSVLLDRVHDACPEVGTRLDSIRGPQRVDEPLFDAHFADSSRDSSAASPRLAVGLDRVRRDAECCRDLGDRQLLVVVQDEACTLTFGKQPEGDQHFVDLLVPDRALVRPRRWVGLLGAGLVSQRHQATSVVVACEVDHDRSQERRCLANVADRARRTVETDERLLHEIFGSIAVVAEHPGEANERGTLFGEHVLDERVRVEWRRRSIERCLEGHVPIRAVRLKLRAVRRRRRRVAG